MKKWNLPIFYCLHKFKHNICHFLSKGIFYPRDPELKKKSKIRAFLAELRVFFFGRLDSKLTFQFRAVSVRPYPHSVSHGAVARNYPITFFPTHFSQLKLYFTATIANYA